jgi:3-dehydroquinate dehydratase
MENYMVVLFKDKTKKKIIKKFITFKKAKSFYDDLLKKSNEVNSIDFISLDTEGNEYEILKNFDFNKYAPKIIIVEHNFDPIKSKQLKKLMETHNYQNVFPELTSYDYFFVLRDVLLKRFNEE